MPIDTNLLADTLLAELLKHHPRVYRNKPPQTPIFPYIVFVLDNTIDSIPSSDYYVHIDIYDDGNKSVRGMESIADTIEINFNNVVIDKDTINLHFDKENRQFVSNEDLGGKNLISIRYNTRVYFK